MSITSCELHILPFERKVSKLENKSQSRITTTQSKADGGTDAKSLFTTPNGQPPADTHDDGNIPPEDLPQKNIIPDEVPRKDGPGGEGEQ